MPDSMDSAVLVAVVVVLGALLLIRRDRARRIGLDPSEIETARERAEAASGALSSADLTVIDGLLARGRKVEAIKLVRERAGMDLREAKEFVEHRSPSPAPRAPNPWGKR